MRMWSSRNVIIGYRMTFWTYIFIYSFRTPRTFSAMPNFANIFVTEITFSNDIDIKLYVKLGHDIDSGCGVIFYEDTANLS